MSPVMGQGREGAPGALDFATLFAADIHDIKNLLFMQLASLDQAMLETGEKDGALRARLADLRCNGQRINDRLVQMLALYKITQGRYQVDIAYHSVAEFLEDMVIETRPLLGGLALSMVAEVDDGLCWFFDRNLVATVVSNAIHNALGHARSQIRLTASSADGFLTIRVEDDGEGFPSEVLAGGAVGRGLAQGGRTGLGLYFSAVAAGLHVDHGRTGRIETSNGGRLGGAVASLFLP